VVSQEREIYGRESELDALRRSFDAAAEGPGVIAIVGEPGIGKTRLVEEICAHADAAGGLVLEGRCAEFDVDAPFGVFADAMDDYLGSLNPRLFEPLPAAARAELSRLFPSLSELGGHGEEPASLQDERYRAHAAVRSLLDLLAGSKPVLLALDDVHWADDASQELISYLIRRSPERRVLVAIAMRPHETPERLRGSLASGQRAEEVELLELGPLEREDAYSLLDVRDEELRARLYDESGGNPFYLEQLSRETARPLGTGILVEDPSGQVPPAVRQAIAGELGRLPDRETSLISGAAVIGESFEPELAATAADLDHADGLSALDELVARDLIRPTDQPRRFRFRHPIVRRAVYDSAKPGWRLAAHGRAADALAGRGASAVERALHVERSAQPGDEDAIALLIEAGTASALRAPGSAAHWFDAALRLLPAGPEGSAKRLEVRIPMAMALGSAGRVTEARDVLRDVLEELPPELAPVRVQIYTFVALLEHLLGNHEAVPPMLERALDELPDPDSPEAARLLIELAADRFYVNDNDSFHARAVAALVAAEDVGDSALTATALGEVAVGAYKLADISEAESAWERAKRIVDGLDDDVIALNLFAPFWLGWYAQCAEHYEDGIAYLDRGLAASRATGQGHLLVPMQVAKSILLTWLGELATAVELADEAVEGSRLANNAQSLAWALTLRCWIATLAGDMDHAIACGTEAVEASSEISDSYYSQLAHCYLGAAMIEAGRAEEGRRLILDAVGDGLDPIERAFRPRLYEILTEAELQLGNLDGADDWARRGQDAIEGVPLPGRQGEALRGRASVELARGNAESAAELAAQAAERFSERSNRVEAARTRTLLGRALVAAGDSDRGAQELKRSFEELRERGADRFADRAAQQLRQLGKRVARTGKAAAGETGIGGLSGREREVAELVAKGHTNKEIAGELFLSEKTIESHLSRIFGKLGVSKRAQVAAAIEREREPA
jgi:DNA-binding CsgD family transcriptional regulator